MRIYGIYFRRRYVTTYHPGEGVGRGRREPNASFPDDEAVGGRRPISALRPALLGGQLVADLHTRVCFDDTRKDRPLVGFKL